MLKQTKREMVRRHRKYARKLASRQKKGGGRVSSTEEEAGQEGDDSGAGGSDVDADQQADELAAKLAGDDRDDPESAPVELLREPRPQASCSADVGEEDPTWAQRSAEERNVAIACY